MDAAKNDMSMILRTSRTPAKIVMWILLAMPLWAAANDDARKLLALAGAGKVAEIRSMLDRGANPDARISDGHITALHRAVEQNQLEVIQLLIERGADINAETSYGITPLVLAATTGRESAVRLLHAHGASLDHKTQSGNTALNLIAHSVSIRPDIVRLLMDLGANPNIPDDSGRTPLHWAAQDANVEMVLLLVSNPKIRLSEIDNLGWTPLYYARERSKWFAKNPQDTKATVELLEKAGAKERAYNPTRLWREFKESITPNYVSH
ncbi:MAG: ankyrin repeat domain-containing protein [Sulfuricaulis sp.]